ncbi:hypothetical protein TSAR_004551 [Trichomalopsis sarcophagae]|uniref:Uncharacterized protein n=1 Tax=Trichomalopsis sarcophagae TaxID=543379 RepID=A0A232ERH1_9HYME|nr:hypothetical protein TSAR_004551 [Trichomalopsis sarcophagae]
MVKKRNMASNKSKVTAAASSVSDRADKIKRDDQKLKESSRCDKKGNSNNIAKLSKKRRVEDTEERKDKGEQLLEKLKKNIQQREMDAPERE